MRRYGITYKNTFGKIFKVKWPFTSLDESKLRPALAISDPNNFGDVEFLFITSKDKKISKNTIKKFKNTISKKINPEQIKYIAMDMSPAFISGASEYFPTAKIVFDKFHVIQMMNNTIDDVGRKEYKTNKTLGKY